MCNVTRCEYRSPPPPSPTSEEEKAAPFSEPHEIVACGILAGSWCDHTFSTQSTASIRHVGFKHRCVSENSTDSMDGITALLEIQDISHKKKKRLRRII